MEKGLSEDYMMAVRTGRLESRGSDELVELSEGVIVHWFHCLAWRGSAVIPVLIAPVETAIHLLGPRT